MCSQRQDFVKSPYLPRIARTPREQSKQSQLCLPRLPRPSCSAPPLQRQGRSSSSQIPLREIQPPGSGISEMGPRVLLRTRVILSSHHRLTSFLLLPATAPVQRKGVRRSLLCPNPHLSPLSPSAQPPRRPANPFSSRTRPRGARPPGSGASATGPPAPSRTPAMRIRRRDPKR